MILALQYKEWLKTRWFLLGALLLCGGTTAYCMLRVFRAVSLRGIGHIWEVMIGRDVIFVESLMWIPTIVGLLLAVVQFVPEVKRKSLKLTLYLPAGRLPMVMSMLAYGVVALLLIAAVDYLIVLASLSGIMAHELVGRVLMAMLPWHLAGLCAYLLAAWVILEPTWRMRVCCGVVGALVLSVFFLGNHPTSYDRFWPVLAVYTLCVATLPWLSVTRFVDGKQ